MIVVSHDREFLDGLVDKVYEFGNQKVVEHLGGIYNFLEHKKMDSLRELERSTGTSTSTSGTGEAQVSQNKLSYEARKELSKAIKKAEKAVAEARPVSRSLRMALPLSRRSWLRRKVPPTLLSTVNILP